MVGWGSIEGNAMTSNLVYLFREHVFNSPADPRTKLSKPRILWHDLTRWFGVAVGCGLANPAMAPYTRPQGRGCACRAKMPPPAGTHAG